MNLLTLITSSPTTFILGSLAILLIIITTVIYLKRKTVDGGSTADPDPARTFPYLLFPLLIIAVLCFLLAGGLFGNSSEILAGLLIVIAIIALIALLFVVAAGFSQLKLTDPKQALGLPEGSIRAMIALMLIMVFIIFGIFVFRTTAVGNETGPVHMTLAQLSQLGERGTSAVEAYKDKAGNEVPGEYNVWLRSDLGAEAMRLATQLLTTVGTLVVAVAGFYFGSSAVSAAVSATQEAAKPPIISSIDPAEGKAGEEKSAVIAGRNLRIPRAVRLARDGEEILATDVLSSAARIVAKLKLDKTAGGDSWDVVVQNDDGTEARLEKAFKIAP